MKKKPVAKEVEECCEGGECCKNESRTHGPSGDTVYGMGGAGACEYFFPQITSSTSVFM